MKIGLSYGRCVRDIAKGLVDIEEVLLVVTKTAIEKREQIGSMIALYGYEQDYLRGLDSSKCLEVALLLWDQGKIYQPRLISDKSSHIASAFLMSGRHGDVWCDLVPSYTGGDPIVEEAYKNFLMVRKLVE